MLSLQIEEVKPFMNLLFLGSAFDAFCLSEATFVTFSTFHIDGNFKADYYSLEDAALLDRPDETYILWREVRPFCLELIRGKRTPLEFKIVFRLSAANAQKLIAQSGLSLTADDIGGLFLNLHFHAGSLACTTGTSLRFFTLDKSLDQVWDSMVKKYFQKYGIGC